MTTEKKTTTTGVAQAIADCGWTVSDACEMRDEAVIEHHRYADDIDRAAAIFEDVPSLLPSYDELKGLGVRVAALAAALAAGFSAAEAGRLLDSGVAALNDAVAAFGR